MEQHKAAVSYDCLMTVSCLTFACSSSKHSGLSQMSLNISRSMQSSFTPSVFARNVADRSVATARG